MLCLQVTTPFPEAYRETLHAYKISEQDTDVRANVRAACSQSVPCYCPHPHVPCFLQAETHTLSHPTNATFYALAASYLSWREISPLLALLLALVEHGSVCMGVCSTPHPISGLSPFPFTFSCREQKLLGKLCEQNKVLREQERLVQQLRAEKVRGVHGSTWCCCNIKCPRAECMWGETPLQGNGDGKEAACLAFLGFICGLGELCSRHGSMHSWPIEKGESYSCTRMLTAAAPLVPLRRVWRVP